MPKRSAAPGITEYTRTKCLAHTCGSLLLFSEVFSFLVSNLSLGALRELFRAAQAIFTQIDQSQKNIYIKLSFETRSEMKHCII